MMKKFNKKRKVQYVNLDEEENLQNSNKKYIRKNKFNFQLFKFIYPFSFMRRVVIPTICLLFILLVYKLFRKRKSSPNITAPKNIVFTSNNSFFNPKNTENNFENEVNLQDPRRLALIKGANYIYKCFHDVNETNSKSNENSGTIKISVIIPVYNNEKNIKSVIRSAQFQSMNEIEIILVNDYSTDNTLSIIQEIQKYDSRIKIINNEKNMGTLYSRSIGVLRASGKYILNLDHDDLFFDNDVFDTVYNEAETKNFDIISFMYVRGKYYDININNLLDGYTTNSKDNFTLYQPDLAYYPMFRDESLAFIDNTIWAKLINADIYKSAVNLLGEERYSVYNIINEDIVSLFAICRMARSYKYLKKYGLFHLIDKTTKPYNKNKEDIMYYDIFFSDVLFDLSLYENKKYAAFVIIGMKSSWSFTILKEQTKQYLIKVIKKILSSEYIADKYKDKIRALYGRLELSAENENITPKGSNVLNVPNISNKENTGNTPYSSNSPKGSNIFNAPNLSNTGNTPYSPNSPRGSNINEPNRSNTGNTGNTPISPNSPRESNINEPNRSNTGNTGNTPYSPNSPRESNINEPNRSNTGNTPYSPNSPRESNINEPNRSNTGNSGNTGNTPYSPNSPKGSNINEPNISNARNSGNTGNTPYSPNSPRGSNINMPTISNNGNTGSTGNTSYSSNSPKASNISQY